MVAVLEAQSLREIHARQVESNAPVEFFMRFASPYGLQEVPRLIRGAQAGNLEDRRQLLTPEGLLYGMPIEKLMRKRSKGDGFFRGELGLLSATDLFDLYKNRDVPVVSVAKFDPNTREIIPEWTLALQNKDGFF